MSSSQVDIRVFSGETFSRKRKKSTWRGWEVGSYCWFHVWKWTTKTTYSGWWFQAFFISTPKNMGKRFNFGEHIFFKWVATSMFMYVLDLDLLTETTGILPLGGGAWSMSNHFFFSTQDISFEASGCALRVQGFMSSVPRHLEALWNKEDTKNTQHDGGFRFPCFNWNISYLFQSKRKEKTWNDHGVFIVERWKISWKDFYPVQVDRTWFACWLYLNYV